MLTLHNAGPSVCSVKVRLALAEKHLDWDDVLLNLSAGDQHAPDYLALNPDGVVPTLVDDGLVVVESGVILQYVDELSDAPVLMPTDSAARALTRLWLLRCLDIHGAINTITFATVNRDRILSSKTPEEIAASIARMPNPRMAAKRRDVLANGLDSSYVTQDFHTLRRTFDDMQAELDPAGPARPRALSRDAHAMADVAILAYIDRLDRFAMSGFWDERTPAVGDWLRAAQARPSYARATERYIGAEEASATRAAGAKAWPAVRERWEAFLARGAVDTLP